MTNGYFSKIYSQSFSEMAQPIYLKNAKGWMLKKNIPNSKFSDLIGCYPYLCCQNWEYLAKDLNDLNLSDIVSMSFVTDPFAKFNDEAMCSSFDFVKPFKNHFIVNLTSYSKDLITKHHKREVHRSSNKGVEIELCQKPISHLSEWNKLYNDLIIKHNIKGLSKFSPESFRTQLSTPGSFMFRAYRGNQTLGYSLWYVENEVAYFHLTANDKT